MVSFLYRIHLYLSLPFVFIFSRSGTLMIFHTVSFYSFFSWRFSIFTPMLFSMNINFQFLWHPSSKRERSMVARLLWLLIAKSNLSLKSSADIFDMFPSILWWLFWSAARIVFSNDVLWVICCYYHIILWTLY